VASECEVRGFHATAKFAGQHFPDGDFQLPELRADQLRFFTAIVVQIALRLAAFQIHALLEVGRTGVGMAEINHVAAALECGGERFAAQRVFLFRHSGLRGKYDRGKNREHCQGRHDAGHSRRNA